MSRKELEKIYFKALNKVKAKTIIKDNVSIKENILNIVDEKIDLNKIKKLYIFSVGKAGFSMAKECEKILEDKIKGGLAISTSKGKLKSETEKDESGEKETVKRARDVEDYDAEPTTSGEEIKSQKNPENRDKNSDSNPNRYPAGHPDNEKDRGNIDLDE